MSDYSYSQREPMENEAMTRTLEAQALAIWDFEKPRLKRILENENATVLDVGCGTGEISSRIARECPTSRVTGIDLAEVNLRVARRRHGAIPNLSFARADAMSMGFTDNSFDSALCRHMLQAVPDPSAVVREMIRVVQREGSLYFLAEDYGMLYFHPTQFDSDEFWNEFAGKAARTTGSDLKQGRKLPSLLLSLQCADIQVEYLVIDTLRVERSLFAEIMTHWRDGFESWISQFSGHPLQEVRARFDDLITSILNPDGYAAWLLPSVTARVTEESKIIAKQNRGR